jgi:hypothetical protein
MAGVTLDAGGLIAVDRNDRHVTVLLARAAETRARVTAASGTADVVDAHVVVCARRADQRVVTSDPDELRRLDPTIEVLRV